MQPGVGALLDESPMTSLDGLIHGSNCRERAEADSKGGLSARTASGSKSLESRPFSKNEGIPETGADDENGVIRDAKNAA